MPRCRMGRRVPGARVVPLPILILLVVLFPLSCPTETTWILPVSVTTDDAGAVRVAVQTDPGTRCELFWRDGLMGSGGWRHTGAFCTADPSGRAEFIDLGGPGRPPPGETPEARFYIVAVEHDTDGDGLSDACEHLIHGTDPANPNCDGDALSDGEEILVWHTDPLNWDTDGDGICDGCDATPAPDIHAEWVIPDALIAGRPQDIRVAFRHEDGAPALESAEVRVRLSGSARILSVSGGAELLWLDESGGEALVALAADGSCELTVRNDFPEWILIGILDEDGDRICRADTFQTIRRGGPPRSILAAGSACLDFDGQDRVTVSLPFDLPWFGRVMPAGCAVSLHGDGLIGLAADHRIDRAQVTLDFPQGNDLPALVLAGFGGSDPTPGPAACVRTHIGGGGGARTWTIEWRDLTPAVNEELDLAYQVRFFEHIPIIEIAYVSDDPVLWDSLAGLRSASGDEGLRLDHLGVRRTGATWALHPGWRQPLCFLDGNDDPDGDGVPNNEEADHLAHPFLADSDGDGLHDGEEIDLGMSPLVFDHDRDGVPDGAEAILVGGSPMVISPNSDGIADALTITARVLSPADTVRIAIATAAGTIVTQDDMPGPLPWRTWQWHGTLNAGTPVPDGLYRWTATRLGDATAAGRGTVLVDLTAPGFAAFGTGDGRAIYNTRFIRLRYRLSEPGVVRFGNDPLNMDSWIQADDEPVDWIIEDGADGPRTVYAQAADAVGNICEPVSLPLTLDTEPPSITSFAIDGGAPVTRLRQVEFFVEAEGAFEVSFRAPEFGDWSEWLLLDSWTPGWFAWPLPDEGWDRILFEARARDAAGNTSATASAEIGYAPPDGGMGFFQASFSEEPSVVHQNPSWSAAGDSLLYVSNGFGSWDGMESYLLDGIVVAGYALLSETFDRHEMQILRTDWVPWSIAASAKGTDGQDRLWVIPDDDFANPAPAAPGVGIPQRDPTGGRDPGEILFVAGDQADAALYALDDSLAAVRLRALPGGRQPSLDPVGRNLLLYAARDGVHLTTLDGSPFPTPSGSSTDWLILPAATCPSFAPDGSRFAAALHEEIVICDADPMNQAAPAAITRSGNNVQPAWAPDGDRVAFVSSRAGAPRIWIRGLPSPWITIDGDAEVATDRNVLLDLDCDGALSIEIWNEGDGMPSELPFTPQTAWVLGGNEGSNTVHAAFIDSDGVEWRASDTIILDLPPRITAAWIGDGSGFTSSRSVEVHVEASGADELRLRDMGGAWGAWMPVTHVLSHVLPDHGYGYYNVEIQARDLDAGLPVQTIQESEIARAWTHYSNPVRIADARAIPAGEDAQVSAMLIATEPGLQIAAAEVFVGVPGPFGEGYAVAAADGAFDEGEERVYGLIPLDVPPGQRTVLYIHAQDSQGRWGAFLDIVVYPNMDDILDQVRKTHERIRSCEYDADIVTWDGDAEGSVRTVHVYRKGPYHLRIDDPERATSTIVVSNRTVIAHRQQGGDWTGFPLAYGPLTDGGAEDFAWTDPEWDVPRLRADHAIDFDPATPQGLNGLYRLEADWTAPRENPRFYDAVALEIDYGAGSVVWERYDDGLGIVTERTVETAWHDSAGARFPYCVDVRKTCEGETIVHTTERIANVVINPDWTEDPFDAAHLP